MSGYFPILICMIENNHAMVIDKPEDLPTGVPFMVLQTNYDKRIEFQKFDRAIRIAIIDAITSVLRDVATVKENELPTRYWGISLPEIFSYIPSLAHQYSEYIKSPCN